MRVMRAHVRNRYILFATTGICTWLVGQALINIMVATGLLPVLGVPLPLISKGGSSTVAIMLAVGGTLHVLLEMSPALSLYCVHNL